MNGDGKENLLSILKKIAGPVLAAVLIEVALFNFAPLVSLFKGTKPMEFSAGDLSFMNWTETEDGWISQADPMIMLENLSVMADTFTIRLTAQPQPDSYTIFYTEGVETFSEKNMIITTDMTGNDTFPLGQRISAIRVDPGEEAGIVLQDVTFIFNNPSWDISISRIVAMLVIWWGTKFLMSLQKAPDYGLKVDDEDAKKRKEDSN